MEFKEHKNLLNNIKLISIEDVQKNTKTDLVNAYNDIAKSYNTLLGYYQETIKQGEYMMEEHLKMKKALEKSDDLCNTYKKEADELLACCKNYSNIIDRHDKLATQQNDTNRTILEENTRLLKEIAKLKKFVWYNPFTWKYFGND